MDRNEIIRMAREAGSIDSEEVIETVFAAFAAAEREAKNELLAALQDLLMDTQHSEHSCGDKNCPVAHAKAVAIKYDAILARGN